MKIDIDGRLVSANSPVYVIAELSTNHRQDYERAVDLVHAAKESGADAVKVQTFTADGHTIDSDKKYFRIHDTPWRDKTLYELYKEASMPWDWQPKLKELARSLELGFFSTAIDNDSLCFLESINVSVYKVPSFEIVDIPLIRKIAKTGKPVILSTGMATLQEIHEAVQTIQSSGNDKIALLKCTSAYPAPADEMNLRTVGDLSKQFPMPIGLSDHTIGTKAAIIAVAQGASLVEKHFKLDNDHESLDASFSADPKSFHKMVEDIRTTEEILGSQQYGPTDSEKTSLIFRRSLFVVQNIAKGEKATLQNIRSIRPGHGAHPRYLDDILGKRARNDIEAGEPVTLSLFGD